MTALLLTLSISAHYDRKVLVSKSCMSFSHIVYFGIIQHLKALYSLPRHPGINTVLKLWVNNNIPRAAGFQSSKFTQEVIQKPSI